MTIIKPILVTAAVLVCCMGNEYPANAQLGSAMAKCWRSNDPYCREHPMDRVLPRETKCEDGDQGGNGAAGGSPLRDRRLEPLALRRHHYYK